MAMNTASFKSVTEPVLNKIFDGHYQSLSVEYSQFLDEETALKRSFEEEPVLVGFAAAPEKGEGGAVTYDAAGESYTARYLHKVYALAFSLTEELVEDGEHMTLGARYSKHLARSMFETKEIVGANILNNAFSGSYTGGDGVSLVNSSHPTYGDGNQSNVLETASDLSEGSLEQMLIDIRKVKDERGLYIALQGQKLIVAPDNQFNAERILNSTLRSGTSDNDNNAQKAMGMLPGGYCVVTRLSDTDSWFIKTNAPEGLKCKKRAAIKRAMEGDFESGNLRYKVRERYSMGWTDWRGVYGTAGAA